MTTTHTTSEHIADCEDQLSGNPDSPSRLPFRSSANDPVFCTLRLSSFQSERLFNRLSWRINGGRSSTCPTYLLRFMTRSFQPLALAFCCDGGHADITVRMREVKHVLLFAAEHDLPWLRDMILQPGGPS